MTEMTERKVKSCSRLILAGLMLAPCARPAAGADAPPAGIPAVEKTAPADTPAAAEVKQTQAKQIQSLVAQLGAEDFHARDEATAKLRALGKPALPALKEAANDPDPEIQTRARKLVKDIETPPKPAEDPNQQRLLLGNGGQIIINGGQIRMNVNGQAGGNGVIVLHTTVTAQNGNGVRDVSVNENGRQVHVHEDKDGLTMSVTEKDAKEPKEYKAKDAEDLKKNDPEAYKIYEQYAGSGGGGVIHIAPVPVP